MHARPLVVLVSAVVLSLAPGCHRRPRGGPALHVTVRAPETRAALDEVLIVGFDRDVARESELGRPAARGDLLRFDPPTGGSARWIDARTLAFTPAPRWPTGAKVRVRVASDLRALDGAPLSAPVDWTFETPRPRIESISPGGAATSIQVRWVELRPTFTARFSLPIDPAEAARRCQFQAEGASSTPVAAKARATADQRIALEPARALARGKGYELVCRGLGPDGAASDPQEPPGDFRQPFRTLGDLQLTGHGPKDGVPADEAEVSLELSNPVDADEAVKKIAIEPAPRGTQRAYGGWDGKLRIGGTFEAGVTYRVTVKRGLADRFGQKLGSEQTFTFRTGDDRPALSLASGLFVVEDSSPLYPIFTRNLDHGVALRLVRVPEDKLVPALSRLSLSGDAADETLSALGLSPRKTTLAAKGRRNHWNDGAIDLAGLAGSAAHPRGVYYLEATALDVPSGRRRVHKVLANVTGLGLVAKIAPAEGVVWVTELQSGKPVAGAEVAIRDPKGRVRFSGRTDAAGLLATPGRDRLAPSSRPARARPAEGEGEDEGEREEDLWSGEEASGRLYVVAKRGDDLAFLSDRWQPGTAAWSFGITPERQIGPVRVRGFLETDRGLYRPGDTVHIKGLVRTARTGGPLRVPAGEKVHVRIADPRGDTLLQKDLRAGAFGGFALDLPTAREARLGDYEISARVREQRFRVGFSVEEYRPATFEVSATADKPFYRVGDKLRVQASASYFYGAPLRGAKVRYEVRRRPRAVSFGDALESFVFGNRVWEGDGADGEGGSRSELVAEDEGKTDERGAFHFALPLPQKGRSAPEDELVEVEVTDETGQARSAHLVVPVHLSDVLPGLKTDLLAPVGKPFAVELVTVGPQGERVAASQVELVLTLRRWACGWQDGSRSYRCQPHDEPLGRRTLDVPASGAPARAELSASRPGEIVVEARARDARGRLGVTRTTVYAWGAGEVSWRSDDSTHLSLIADRGRYKPGETARLLVQAPYAGSALVTVEREAVLEKRLVALRAGAETIEIPLGERELPNVYVSVVLVGGRTGGGDRGRPHFKIGLATLQVVPDGKRLSVRAEPDRPSYRPGETVRVRLQVSDAAGKPARAEVALAAADEGVLSLVAYKTPDPMAVFYAPWGLGVETSTSYERFAHRADPEDDEGGGVGDGGPAEGNPTRVRSRFLPTAYWNPALRTDAEGHAEVHFVAPDNLTAFRVMAVAADAADRFGSGEVRFRVQKPFALHPVAPRFLLPGDAARVGVVVQNDSAGQGSVTVEAELEGLEAAETPRRTVTVGRNARVPVLFEVRAKKTGAAVLRFRSRLGAEKDAVQITLPILRPTPLETLTLAEGETTSEAGVKVATPPQALPGQGGLELTVDASGLAGLSDGLRYLIEYPYG